MLTDWKVTGTLEVVVFDVKTMSLIPSPPPIFVFRFVFRILHGNQTAAKIKTGKAWEHFSGVGRCFDKGGLH